MKKVLITLISAVAILSAMGKDPKKRGMFVDRFIVYKPSLAVDTANSILGNTTREDSLLNYCVQNHVTYLCFYSLYPAIAGSPALYDSTYRQYFSCFITRARENYCVEQIGASGSSDQFFHDVDSEYTLIQSAAYSFARREDTSMYYNKVLDLVTGTYDPKTNPAKALLSEWTKFYLRIRDFNSVFNNVELDCQGVVDVLTLEEEFWNAGSTASDISADFWNTHLHLVNVMASIRDINNSTFGSNELMTEDYIGKFHLDTINDNDQADTLDQLLDRFLMTFYTPTDNSNYGSVTEFFRPSWQEARLVQLGHNAKKTVIYPLFSGEYSTASPFLGLWLQDTASAGNWYRRAEEIWKGLYGDSLTYGTNTLDHYGNVFAGESDAIQGYMWFDYSQRMFESPGPFDTCAEDVDGERLAYHHYFNEPNWDVRIVNDNVQYLLPEGLSGYEFDSRLYSIDGRLLNDHKLNLAPGENLVLLPQYGMQMEFLQIENLQDHTVKTLLIPLH